MKADLKLNLEKGAALVAIIGFPLFLASLLYAIRLDENQLKIAKSQNTIALNQLVFGNPQNLALIEAIESNKPILKAPSGGGEFSNTQFDKYLGDYETVHAVYEEGFLTEHEICGSFSAYLQEVEANKEIADYLKRKENADYFDGLRSLFALVDNSQDPDCRKNSATPNQ